MAQPAQTSSSFTFVLSNFHRIPLLLTVQGLEQALVQSEDFNPDEPSSESWAL